MWGYMRLRVFSGALLLFLLTCANCWDESQFQNGAGRFPSTASTQVNQEQPLQRAKIRSGWPSSSELRHHPLDPLTEEEIEMTVAIIKNFGWDDLIFNYITLKEPEKSLLLPYFLQDVDPSSGNIPRKSFVILYDRETQRTFEVTVNLDRRQIENWKDAPNGVQPIFTPDEMLEAEQIARRDPAVIERSRKLGWTDMTLVNGDLWSMGYIGDRPEYQGRRVIQLYMFGKNFKEDNQYTHPFDFLPIIDLDEGRVINIEDLPTHEDFNASNKKGNIVPRESSNFDSNLRGPSSYRQDLRPINISQPDGVSYSINGNEVRWQKYKFRVGFNAREGLIIHHLNYKDGSQVRPLFYRMSLAEMFIPYGDPRPPYHRKHVFDEGDYGVGFISFELRPQMDCVGEVHFFDGILHNEKGEVKRTPRAVCLYEEDAGILWKHTDFRSGRNSVVRSQRLALTYIVTAGNYDYINTWFFYQDGTIEFNVKLSGILSIALLAVNATPAGHGSIVFPQLNAQYHQHFFALRLDPEIDGNENTVAVSDVVPLPMPTGSPGNPYGQGFTSKTTVLRTAGGARTNIAPQSSRTWHIRNPNKKNPYTKGPVAWKLMPWPSPPLMMRQDSPIREQARFLDYNTWVTPYNDDQMFPGGFYLNNSGLPEWVGENLNADVENTDIVLWHNFGVSHVPRTEDFPIMPVETCGIMLKPLNFFNENPALDVPPAGGIRGRDEL